MHIQQEYVKKYPVRAYLHHLRKSAKKRGKPCTLTFEYLDEFLKGKKFFGKTGLAGDSLTIDCIESQLGYADGNIQILTRKHNSEKYWATDRHYRFSDIVYHDVGEVEFKAPF